MQQNSLIRKLANKSLYLLKIDIVTKFISLQINILCLSILLLSLTIVMTYELNMMNLVMGDVFLRLMREVFDRQ